MIRAQIYLMHNHINNYPVTFGWMMFILAALTANVLGGK